MPQMTPDEVFAQPFSCQYEQTSLNSTKVKLCQLVNLYSSH